MSYNSNPSVETLASALAMDPNLRQNAVSRYFENQSSQYNALKQFTSVFDPKKQVGSGVRSVFAERTDLRAGGAQSVNFNIIGVPGGPGVQGDTELTGNTSRSLMATYPVVVDWVRDAFELTEDEVEMLAAGRSIEQTSIDLLAEKMGNVKQNHMLMRLIAGADGNVYRPNNRSNINALTATDVLTPDDTTNVRARLQTLGAKPLMRDMAKTGCPIDKYLIFSSNTGMLPIRNDSSFQTAISNADVRGPNNANFSGEILSWQGNPFYEFPVMDQDWDDFKGGPLIAKAELGVGFGYNSASADAKLVVNANNTKSRYFQWFAGYQFNFNRVEAVPDLSTNEYYAWIINPDGTVGFVAYAGNHNGNQITITKILTKNGAGTSTKGATTVGQLTVNTTANPDEWTGGNGNLPVSGPNGAWSYTDTFVPGAIILQANSQGVCYSRSFAFGAMAAC